MKTIQIGKIDPRYPIFRNQFSDIVIIKKLFNKLLSKTEDKGLIIWVTGSSGVSVATLFLSLMHRKLQNREIHVVQIRKNNDHHENNNKNNIKILRKQTDCIHVFMDDCICSGETFKRVLKESKRIDVALIFNRCISDDKDLLEKHNVKLLIHPH